VLDGFNNAIEIEKKTEKELRDRQNKVQSAEKELVECKNAVQSAQKKFEKACQDRKKMQEKMRVSSLACAQSLRDPGSKTC